jgi:hypothetical protein
VALIVPAVALPPGMPFTLQVTVVSLALLTVARKLCVEPSTTDALPGVIATLMEAGEGGGGDGSAAELAPPLAQPSRHALAATTAARKAMSGMRAPGRGGNAIA